MPFRRRSAKMNNRISRAAGAACEPLEQRRLLTALVNGVFTGTNSIYEGTSIFEYRQPGNATIRISVVGNITAEFIGAHSYGSIDTPTPENPVADQDRTPPQSGVLLSDLVPGTQATSAVWLFSIYVVQADAGSAISIAQVPNLTATPAARPMQPFTGSITIATGATGAQPVATTGGVLIGCTAPTTAGNVPLIYADRKAFGMRPSSAGTLYAGLETAPGVNLGKFFVGGGITGVVDVAGSMDSFYAGNIWTGNAQGLGPADVPGHFTSALFGVSTPTQENNFHIGGDIRNILVGNSIGTDNLTPLASLDAPTYKTGFQMSIGGRVGQIVAVNSILGSGTVRNSSDTSNTGGAQHELENKTAVTTDLDFSYFDPQFEGINIAVADTTVAGAAAAARLNANDTFGTPQFLGTVRSSVLKDNNAIQLRGQLTQTNADLVDFYAISLLAGQTIDVQLRDDYMTNPEVDTHPRLGIFDPDGRLIASDYSDVNEFSRLNKTIRITADRPGAYRIAIGTRGDINFNGAADAGETVTSFGDLNYELRVTNAGNVALGGLISTGPIGTLDVGSIGFNVLRGDLGEIRSGTPAALTVTNPFTSTNLTGTGVIYSASLPWRIAAGNLRSLETVRTTTITVTNGALSGRPGSGPDFLVPKGSIGLLRSTAAQTTTAQSQSIFAINDDNASNLQSASNPAFPTPSNDLTLTNKSLAVGKNIQLVDVAGVLEGDLLANGSIGVIRAAQIGGNISPFFMPFPVIQADVDRKGSDGTIDLIDVTLDLRSPAISTGPGGNIRYIHVAGNVYRDTYFGGAGFPESHTYGAGQKVTITDDSGTTAILTPTPLDPNTTVPLPQNALTPYLDPPALTLQTYPIRSGGEVVIRVIVTPQDDTTDGVVRTGGGGLLVETGAHGPNGSFEIGEVARGVPSVANANLPVLTLPAGTAANTFTFDPFNRIYTVTALTGTNTDPRDVNFTFRGKSKIDVWNFNDLITGDTITSINNQTAGEIVNIQNFAATGAPGANVPDIFSIEAETLGLARSSTGTAVEGLAYNAVVTGQTGGLNNIYPFVNQRILVNVADVPTITVRRGLGNILAQNIGSIVTNSDHKNVSGVFEGINGPVVSRGTTNLTGNILSVDIGEGVAPSGSGYVVRSGIYVDGQIDSIVGRQTNADIRGNIVAGFQTPVATQQATDPVTGIPLTNPDGTPRIISTPTSAIGSIVLKGGSIIGANIITNIPVAPATVGAPAFSSDLYNTEVLPLGGIEAIDSINAPLYDIGNITLTGNGGVLGSRFFGGDIGLITVKGGFGVLESQFITQDGGAFNGIVADGYGIRDVVISTGAISTLDARGTGKNVPVTQYNSSVRFSDKSTFDPYSGESLNETNDLNKALGTTRKKPKISGVTATGLIEDSKITSATTVGKISAQRILARDAFDVNESTGKKKRIAFGQDDYPLVFNFGSSVGSLTVRDNLDGLSMTSGAISKINIGKDVVSSSLTIRGHVKELSAGSVRSSSTLNVLGPDGQIDSIVTKNDLSARTIAEQGILSMKIGGNINSKQIEAGGNTKTLTINGSILTGSKVVIAGTLSKLTIGHDIKAGATLEAGAIQEQTIKGQVIGDIVIN